MKVILLHDVDGVGKKNTVVEVKDGYGKNFLLKKKLAMPVNLTNQKKLKSLLTKQKAAKDEEVMQLHLLKKTIESLKPVFHLKATASKTFGTVSHHQVLEYLESQGVTLSKFAFIDHKQFGIGIHEIKLKLHKNLIAMLTIDVQAIDVAKTAEA